MKKLIAILVILCTLVSILPMNAFADSVDYVRVTKNNAPLRSDHNEDASVVCRATKGTILEVVDTNWNWWLTKWYKVKTGNGNAYIFYGNVEEAKNVSGFTNAIKLSTTSKELNLRGTKTINLKAICKYKDRTDTNVTWTSSNPSVATVDSNGKVTALKLGYATIAAKHNVYGTTATCKISIVEQVILSAKATEQSNSSCCSGAAARTVLQSLKGSSFTKTDLQLYKEMGSKGVVYKIRDLLNDYLGKTVYKYGTYSTQEKYEKAVIKSINAGYPVIALVKINSTKYFKYTSSGHFTVINGYEYNPDGSIDFRVTDSYKVSKNKGTFWVPAKAFFGYSKAHGNPYYLILKK